MPQFKNLLWMILFVLANPTNAEHIPFKSLVSVADDVEITKVTFDGLVDGWAIDSSYSPEVIKLTISAYSYCGKKFLVKHQGGFIKFFF